MEKTYLNTEETQLLSKLRKQRDEAYYTTETYRELGRKIKRYFKGEQLPPDVIAQLQNRESER